MQSIHSYHVVLWSCKFSQFVSFRGFEVIFNNPNVVLGHCKQFQSSLQQRPHTESSTHMLRV